MKTERGEGDQRHVEFTITLLGCTVIKEKSPRRERGGSRPAQSVLSLPWSPACRPQKHTAKPSGRTPFIALGTPPPPSEWLQRICKASTDCHGTGSSQFRGRRSALDEPLPGSQSFFSFSFFFDVLMKIFRTFLRASCYARTCQPPRLGKKRIFGMWFSQKVSAKRNKKERKKKREWENKPTKPSLIPLGGSILIWLKCLFFQKNW